MSALHRTTFNVMLLLVGPYLVICAVYLPRGLIRRFNRLGDYSYGTYIYGYPAQFTVISSLPFVTPWQLTSLSVPIALALAALSWHLVEKRSLKAVARCELLAERVASLLRGKGVGSDLRSSGDPQTPNR
jgi:peptidoglycan/LPS O-acetylase OafA/YrhL